jgi:hypothetical protein
MIRIALLHVYRSLYHSSNSNTVFISLDVQSITTSMSCAYNLLFYKKTVTYFVLCLVHNCYDFKGT